MELASYTKIPHGDGFLFNVIPAHKRVSFSSRILTTAFLCGLAVYGIAFGVNTALSFKGGSLVYFGVFFTALAFMLIMAWGFMRDDCQNNYRCPSSFMVYPTAIEINGQKIEKENMCRLVVRNTFNSVLLSTTVSAPAQLGINNHEQISYAINIEMSNKTIWLAGGMDKITAYILHSDISRILRLDQ